MTVEVKFSIVVWSSRRVEIYQKIVAMIKFLLVLSVAVAAKSCVVDVKNDGTVTARSAYPSHVLIETYLTYNLKRMCSGVLINVNFALTTANCVTGFMFVNVHIYPHLLRDPYEKDRQIYRATTVSIKPDYNTTNSLNDVALVKLPVTLSFTSTTYSIANIPELIYQITPGQQGELTYWGLTDYNDEKAVNYKQAQTMEFIADADCRASYPGMWTDERDYAGRMCIKKLGGGDNCDSDNGSPIFMGSFVFGLLSFGQREACSNAAPAGIQEVRYHRIWIEDEIKRLTT